MLTIDHSLLLVIDVQGKLAGMMHHPRYLRGVLGMMKAATFMDIPIVLTEQAPEKIGATIDEVLVHAPRVQPIVKQSFSCGGEPLFIDTMKRSGRKQILVAGIEAHVCVYQTVRDLIKAGYEVYLVADAVSSRAVLDYETGVHRCEKEGAILTTLEMVVTELMRSTRHPRFRDVMALLKENK
jgi:nicotinamidase-related amidase